MTTRESFRPRLRTRDRAPELVAFAAVIVLSPGSAAFFGVLAGGGVAGAAGTVRFAASAVTVGGVGSAGLAATACGTATVAGGLEGWPVTNSVGAAFSLPSTSITTRSGSRK